MPTIVMKNIGIIDSAEIEINGLTVITGRNNSGKTTVGKALFAVIDSLIDVPLKFNDDRRLFIIKALIATEGCLYPLDYLSHKNSTIKGLIEEMPVLSNILYNGVDFSANISTLLDNVNTLKENLSVVSDLLLNISENNEEDKRRLDLVIAKIEDANKIIIQLIEDLDNNSDLYEYMLALVNKNLNSEFSNQIQPVNVDVEESIIKIYSSDSVDANIVINSNSVNNEFSVVNGTDIENIFLIDDPLCIDGTSKNSIDGFFSDKDSHSIIEQHSARTHRDKLIDAMRNSNQTVLEEVITNKSISQIKEKINAVIPGTFEFGKKERYYVCDNGKKLVVSNLATGSKLFSIIKILLESGKIDSKTLFVFDEPEAHLHPEWQNEFAELIVLLVKEMGVKVLLTTHSSNFALAIDAYSKNYEITDVTNYYQTNMMPSKMVNYVCINNQHELLYSDFLRYFSKVKELNDKYSVE